MSYLQEQDELGEALNWLHHEAVQGDAVKTGGLLLLEHTKMRILKQNRAGKIVWCREAIKRKLIYLLLDKPVRILY